MTLYQNDKTIEAYDQGALHYIKNTPSEYNASHESLLRWIHTSLSVMPKNGRIFEIGSGPGRDASYMEKIGFDIVRSDASASFVSYLKDSGKDAIKYNVLREDIPKGFHMFFANAVFPHMSASDFKKMLSKFFNAMREDDVLAFSVKQGTGETWIKEKIPMERFVHYWQPINLLMTVENAGFEIIFLDQSIPGDLPGHTWTLLTLRKRQSRHSSVPGFHILNQEVAQNLSFSSTALKRS